MLIFLVLSINYCDKYWLLLKFCVYVFVCVDFEKLCDFFVLALSVKKNERKRRERIKEKKFRFNDLKLVLALSGLEDIQGGCFPD